jgi:hypothetical protein
VGGAASVLAVSRARGVAVAGAAAGLVAYVAVAQSLPNVSSRADVAVLGVLVLPAFMALLWLALPLWRSPFPLLLFGGMGLVAVWIVLDVVGLDSLADVVKLGSFALLGFWLLSLFDELWWVALVAALIPWIDAWSVATGPTRYVTQEQPGFFGHVSVAFPVTGENASINMGPPDVIFFALFLAAADRFRLRVGWTWLAMTAFLSLTILLVWWFVHSGLPALPAVAVGFLVPNADLIWRHVRETRRARRELESAK